MKRKILLLCLIVLGIFTSCKQEPEPEVVSGVFSVTIVNKSGVTLNIDSVEYFEAVSSSIYTGWNDVSEKGKFIAEIDVDYELLPDHSKTINIPYEYTKEQIPLGNGSYTSSGKYFIAKLNCTYDNNLVPVVGIMNNWDYEDRDYPLLSEKYIGLTESVSLEFKSFNSESGIEHSLVYTL